MYCAHAKKKNIDLDDVKLAVQMQLDQNYTTPPPRDVSPPPSETWGEREFGTECVELRGGYNVIGRRELM